MHPFFRARARSLHLSTIAPLPDSADYLPELARIAASALYPSPLPSPQGNLLYILNSANLPDEYAVDYSTLLPYVLARLPTEEELVKGAQYEIIFFTDHNAEGNGEDKKRRPGFTWVLQAYQVLSRAMRKRIQRLYIVHEKTWVKMLVEMSSTFVSPKFRKKIVHAATLSDLATYLTLEDLLIPPATYLQDRKLSPEVVTRSSGVRAFGAEHPLPSNAEGKLRLPRVLRETTSFLLLSENAGAEGLFRVPPNARFRDVLREAYDRGQKYIVWQEHGHPLPFPEYLTTQQLHEALAGVDASTAYSVHLAAGLCKLWYAELKKPLVPQTSYAALRSQRGDAERPFTLEALIDLFQPGSDQSPIPKSSREIATRHLLPMLSTIVEYQDSNKMTPANIATCFAPSLLRGPDAIEDAGMLSTVSAILIAALDWWPEGLAEACGKTNTSLQEDLKPPVNFDDFEDPIIRPGSPECLEPAMPGVGSSRTYTEGVNPPLEPGAISRTATSPSSSLHTEDFGPEKADASIDDSLTALPESPPPLPLRRLCEITRKPIPHQYRPPVSTLGIIFPNDANFTASVSSRSTGPETMSAGPAIGASSSDVIPFTPPAANPVVVRRKPLVASEELDAEK